MAWGGHSDRGSGLECQGLKRLRPLGGVRARLKLCLQGGTEWRLHVVFRGGIRTRGPLNHLHLGDPRLII